MPKLSAIKTPDAKQKSISSFFTRSQKRSLVGDEAPPSKLSKTCEESTAAVVTGNLSPEQKKKIEENKLKAQSMLQEKALGGADIGPSWKSALAKEFIKPYYVEVGKQQDQNNVLPIK